MANKKTIKKTEVFDITTGSVLDLNKVEPTVETKDESQFDIEKAVDNELERLYGDHVKYPTSTGLLLCILRELVKRRLGG